MAGAPDAALAMLAMAQAGQLDELQSAVVDLVRAQIAFGSSHGRDAPPLLLAAAKRLEPLDPMLARDTYLDALTAALMVGRLAGEVGLPEVAREARATRSGSTRPGDLILDALACVITDGYAEGAPLLKQAVHAFRDADLPIREAVRWLWFATHCAHDWDDENSEVLCSRLVLHARQAGASSCSPSPSAPGWALHIHAPAARRGGVAWWRRSPPSRR